MCAYVFLKIIRYDFVINQSEICILETAINCFSDLGLLQIFKRLSSHMVFQTVYQTDVLYVLDQFWGQTRQAGSNFLRYCAKGIVLYQSSKRLIVNFQVHVYICDTLI